MSTKKIAVMMPDGRITSRTIGSTTRQWGWNPGSTPSDIPKKREQKPPLSVKLIKAAKAAAGGSAEG